MIAASLERSLRRQEPVLWLNERWRPIEASRSSAALGVADLCEAEARLARFAPLLAKLFPELAASRGIIESPLYAADTLQPRVLAGAHPSERWLIKADHALPVAGSIKARGGIFEVLVHAERLALRGGVLRPEDDRANLASANARSVFAQHQVIVGSTGNLGLSIGTMAAALGFQAIVHMSSDAKTWKKARLRACGVQVIEHVGDYGAAVEAGRAEARNSARAYFVDDENSRYLFLGYGVAALRLKQQLIDRRIEVDARHPLFVYLPCGVGGAPGGIAFGLRHLFGDHVHCFFAEPVASPCMLLRLANSGDRPISVQALGLDNRTEADGLAVATASEFVVPLIRPLLSGIFTVRDADLFEDLYHLRDTLGHKVEPSAVAGFRGPRWLLRSEPGRHYLADHGASEYLENATHVLWTTGGALLPEEEYQLMFDKGRRLAACGPV